MLPNDGVELRTGGKKRHSPAPGVRWRGGEEGGGGVRCVGLGWGWSGGARWGEAGRGGARRCEKETAHKGGNFILSVMEGRGGSAGDS